jgi:hypothetical protein
MGKLSNRIKKHPKVVALAISRNFIQHALTGIRRDRSRSLYHHDPNPPLKIQPLIHKIVLTGDWKQWKNDRPAIWKMFGKLYKDNDYKPKDEDENGYQEKWLTRRKGGFLIIVYAFPKDRRAPYWMEIHVSDQASVKDLKGELLRIWLALPTAKVSLIDYTLDQYCYSPHAAQMLFWVEMRNLYVPHQRKARLTGAKLSEWGNKNRMNTAYRATNVQVYERGPDNKKKDDHWQFEDVDRVRLEYTAKRRRLLKNEVDTIGDFIKRPRFHDINRNVYRFASFEHSNKLPAHSDDYDTPDDTKPDKTTLDVEKEIFGAFQLEYNRYRKDKKITKNIAQNVKELDVFEPFKARLDEVMREYYTAWKKTK